MAEPSPQTPVHAAGPDRSGDPADTALRRCFADTRAVQLVEHQVETMATPAARGRAST